MEPYEPPAVLFLSGSPKLAGLRAPSRDARIAASRRWLAAGTARIHAAGDLPPERVDPYRSRATIEGLSDRRVVACSRSADLSHCANGRRVQRWAEESRVLRAKPW